MTRRLLPRHGTRSRWQVASAALLMAVGLSACQVASPITTDLIYDPGDGVSADLGSVVMRDLLVVSEGRGTPGAIVGMAVNRGTEPVEVTVSVLDAGMPSESVDSEIEAAPPRPELPSEQELAALQAATTSFSLTREVTGQRSARLDGGQTPVPGSELIPAIVTDAGMLVTLQLQSSDGEIATVAVPVLPPCGPYSDVIEAQFPEACGWDRIHVGSDH